MHFYYCFSEEKIYHYFTVAYFDTVFNFLWLQILSNTIILFVYYVLISSYNRWELRLLDRWGFTSTYSNILLLPRLRNYKFQMPLFVGAVTLSRMSQPKPWMVGGLAAVSTHQPFWVQIWVRPGRPGSTETLLPAVSGWPDRAQGFFRWCSVKTIRHSALNTILHQMYCLLTPYFLFSTPVNSIFLSCRQGW